MQELCCCSQNCNPLSPPPMAGPEADVTLGKSCLAATIKSLAAGAGLCQAAALDPHPHSQAAAGRVTVWRRGFAHLGCREAGQGHTHRHAPLRGRRWAMPGIYLALCVCLAQKLC